MATFRGTTWSLCATTRSKKLLGAPGIATSNKGLTTSSFLSYYSNKGHCYERSKCIAISSVTHLLKPDCPVHGAYYCVLLLRASKASYQC